MISSNDWFGKNICVRVWAVKEGPKSRGDGALPTAATCFFTIYVPTYSSQQIMSRQLIIAIETEDFGTR